MNGSPVKTIILFFSNTNRMIWWAIALYLVILILIFPIKLQAKLLEDGMSINRYSRLKSVVSSLSNYCECVLSEDEEYALMKKATLNSAKT